VLLYAWPSQGVATKLQPGQSVRVKLVGQTVSDMHGRTRLAAPQTANHSPSNGVAGNVNFDPVTVGANGMTSYGFSRKIGASAGASAAAAGLTSTF
jgi:hypothetical protein